MRDQCYGKFVGLGEAEVAFASPGYRYCKQQVSRRYITEADGVNTHSSSPQLQRHSESSSGGRNDSRTTCSKYT